MSDHAIHDIVIDGNNLLHAMHEHAPIQHVGRETLVKIVERWALGADRQVTLVFDGPKPRGGLAKQLSSKGIDVTFSERETADDVIVRMIHLCAEPIHLQIVSTDGAIRYEARRAHAAEIESASFVRLLFASPATPDASPQAQPEKPPEPTVEQTEAWLKSFGYETDDEPFDGFDAMTD